MKKLLYPFVVLALMACGEKQQAPIDREALVDRNSPQVTAFDSLASLSVGNGEFAFTVDVTGLQTFPEMYTKGVPLGTQSQWGWHEFTNPKGYRHEETLKDYDFGRGRMEPYSVQFNEDGRQKEAANWFRVNPHRLHLGMVGFEFGRDPLAVAQVTDIKQKLNLWEGVINSSFKLDGKPFEVQTACHPKADMVAATIRSEAHASVNFRFPYPTGGHCDDACNWTSNDKHSTAIVSQDEQQVVLKRTLDATTYYVTIRWEGKATFGEKEKNYFVLTPEEDILAFTCAFTPENSSPEMSTSEQTRQAAADDRDQRNEGVAEGVVIDDLLFGKALGACGADVVRVEHLEHVRAGVAHERTRADDDQRDNGQHEMVRLIHDLTPAAELVVVAADQTEQIEPAELDGKDQLQKRSEEEGRQRDTGQRDNRDRVVGSAVLLGCGDDAEGNRDEDLKDEGDAAHHEGEPDAVVELLKHRHGVEPAVAEITADGGTEPGKITGNDALIHVVHGIELRHPIVEALRARLHGLLARHILNEGSRQAAHQQKDDGCDQ